MTRILYIAPGDNPHTWKWVGWFGKQYPGEISLIPYQSAVPDGALEGVEILNPHIPGFKIASTVSWTEIGRIRRLVRDIRPAVLHALWAYGSGTYGARSSYHPFILSPWGSDITAYATRSGLKGKIQKRLVVEALESADSLTATSRFLREKVKALVPKKDIRLIQYGVDTARFDPGAVESPMKFIWPDGAPLGGRTFTVGFFKSLEKTYGPDILLSAVNQLAPKLPNLRCIIAGAGSMRNELIRKAAELGIDNRVCFPGRIPEVDMPRALANVDVFVMPSRREALGVAALEASSMKKPVIVAEYQGMKEVMINEKTGLFFDPEDDMMLADQIYRLSQEPTFRTQLGEAGREFVKTNFEYDDLMEKADAYISEILKEYSK